MRTVLFVDDDEAFREICRRIFEDEGYRVLLAEDGMQAMDAFRKGNPDVAVLDVRMPRMSGLEVAERINRINSRLPIILYTANDEICTMDRRTRFAAACVAKSSDFTELALAVNRVLSPGYEDSGFRFGLPHEQV